MNIINSHIIIAILILCILSIIDNTFNNISSNNSCKTENFTSQNNSKTRVELYHAPWCGYSRQMYPIFDKVIEKASDNNNNLITEKIDCDNESNRKRCTEEGIRGFPTIKIKKNNENIEYYGERNATKILEACGISS